VALCASRMRCIRLLCFGGRPDFVCGAGLRVVRRGRRLGSGRITHRPRTGPKSGGQMSLVPDFVCGAGLRAVRQKACPYGQAAPQVVSGPGQPAAYTFPILLYKSQAYANDLEDAYPGGCFTSLYRRR
jgi:hypothetical protein